MYSEIDPRPKMKTLFRRGAGGKEAGVRPQVFLRIQLRGDVPPEAMMQRTTIGGRPEFVDVE